MPNDTAVTVANNAIAPPPERRLEEEEEIEEEEEEFGPKGGGLIVATIVSQKAITILSSIINRTRTFFRLFSRLRLLLRFSFFF